MTDPRAIERILAKLPPEDAAILAAEIGASRSLARRTRLDARDAVIRDLGARFYVADQWSDRSKLIARDLRNRGLWANSEHRDLLLTALDLNAGKPLSWRQVRNVLEGNRTPPVLQ